MNNKHYFPDGIKQFRVNKMRAARNRIFTEKTVIIAANALFIKWSVKPIGLAQPMGCKRQTLR